MKSPGIDLKRCSQSIVILVLAAVFFFVAALPQARDLSKERKKLKAMQAEIASHTEEMRKMEDLLATAESQKEFVIGDEDEILPELLKLLAREGERHRVRIISMKPGDVERNVVNSEGINMISTKLRIEVKARGGFVNIGEYLKALEEMPILVAVRTMRIAKEQEGSRMLDADLVIETYALSDEN
jgi:Tfp pilus assembly protein PilO